MTTVAMPRSLRNSVPTFPRELLQLNTREGSVEAFEWLVHSFQDPYLKYMTRDEVTSTNIMELTMASWVRVPFCGSFYVSWFEQGSILGQL
jgi:hypothetical protein